MEYLVKGILIGLSVAIPVGPIGVLTIKRSLSDGRVAGLATGMGAAAADTLYGAMAAFGMTAISQFLLSIEFPLKLAGGLFLMYLGIQFFRSKPPKESTASSNGIFYNFASTFALTVVSPATIFAFLAVFAAAGLGTQKTDFLSASMIVTGVFIGSGCWWLFLSWFVSRFRSSMGTTAWIWLNRGSGMIIGGFGLWTLVQAIMLVMKK